MSSLPAEGQLLFATEQSLEEAAAVAGIEHELVGPLWQTLRKADTIEPLRAVIHHASSRLITDEQSLALADWPPFDHWLPGCSDHVCLLLALACVPVAMKKHASMHVDPELTRDTLKEIRDFASMHKQFTGRVSIYAKQLHWLRHYIAGRLFRFGRCEFMVRPFGPRMGHSICVYQNNETNEHVAFAKDGVCFSAQGYIDRLDRDDDWTATLKETDRLIVGHKINERGAAERTLTKLPKADWQCVLDDDDPVLDMHIPAAGPLTVQSVMDSIRRAFAFYDERGQHTKAAVCNSWVCGPQLLDICPPKSNLHQFVAHFDLFPVPHRTTSGLAFLFGESEVDPATARRDTSLQRAILDYIEAGNRWRGGGMYCLRSTLTT